MTIAGEMAGRGAAQGSRLGTAKGIAHTIRLIRQFPNDPAVFKAIFRATFMAEWPPWCRVPTLPAHTPSALMFLSLSGNKDSNTQSTHSNPPTRIHEDPL